MEKEEKRVEARVVEETLEQMAKEQRKVEEEEGKSLLEQFQVHLKGQFQEFTAHSGSLKAIL